MTIQNRAPDGSYLANMQLSMERLARYVELAQNGRTMQLYQEIDDNTKDATCHPNQIIFGAVLIMASMRQGTGRSFVPLIKNAAKKWSSGVLEAAGIWHG